MRPNNNFPSYKFCYGYWRFPQTIIILFISVGEISFFAYNCWLAGFALPFWLLQFEILSHDVFIVIFNWDGEQGWMYVKQIDASSGFIALCQFNWKPSNIRFIIDSNSWFNFVCNFLLYSFHTHTHTIQTLLFRFRFSRKHNNRMNIFLFPSIDVRIKRILWYHHRLTNVRRTYTQIDSFSLQLLCVSGMNQTANKESMLSISTKWFFV